MAPNVTSDPPPAGGGGASPAPDLDPRVDGRPILVFLRRAQGYARLLLAGPAGDILSIRLSPMKALVLLALKRVWGRQGDRMDSVRGYIPVAEGPELLAKEAGNLVAYGVDAFSKNLLKAQKAVDAGFDAAGQPRPARLVEREQGVGLRLRPPGLRVYSEDEGGWLFAGDDLQPAGTSGLADGEATTPPDAVGENEDTDADADRDEGDAAEANGSDGRVDGPTGGRADDPNKLVAASLARAARAS